MDLEYEYMTGQRRDSFPALLAAFAQESADAVTRLSPELDVVYGPHPRQRFDLFLPQGRKPRAVVIYYHAGYWQSRDKADFRFLASAYVDAGLAFAPVNYPLCPDVTLDELLVAVEPSVDAVIARLRDQLREVPPVILMGHSAGAHIAVKLARHPAVAGIVGISGVYELAPLIPTSLNANLRLDEAAAARNSVHEGVASAMPPAIFVVGGDETPEFIRQTKVMHDAWRRAGNRAELFMADNDNHFSVLRTLCRPDTWLHEAITTLATRTACPEAK